MSDPRPDLKPFVEALRIGADGQLALGGQPVRRAPGQVPAGGRLAADLTLCVYEHAYAAGYPPAPAGPVSADGLVAALAQANGTPDRAEQGWMVEESQADGSVIAVRHGRRGRFAPGQFLVADGVAPPRPGAAITAHLPGGTAARQPGFYHCFGLGRRDIGDTGPLVRLYWHVRMETAAAFIRLLTTALNLYRIPFELKIVTDPAQFARRDKAVLYVAQDDFTVAALALAPQLGALAAMLHADVPLFTKRLGDGIGLAEDPGKAGESFGSLRSRLTAAALLASRSGDGFSGSAFDAAFADAVAAEGLRIDALWLNPGAEDDYALPPVVGAAAAR